MISEDERIRVETLKTHVFLNRVNTVRAELFKKSQEYQKKAEEILIMKDD